MILLGLRAEYIRLFYPDEANRNVDAKRVRIELSIRLAKDNCSYLLFSLSSRVSRDIDRGVDRYVKHAIHINNASGLALIYPRSLPRTR